jgi:hypothetical protein
MRLRNAVVGSLLVLVGVALGSMLNRPSVAQPGAPGAPAASIGRYQIGTSGDVAVIIDTTNGHTWSAGVIAGPWRDHGAPTNK